MTYPIWMTVILLTPQDGDMTKRHTLISNLLKTETTGPLDRNEREYDQKKPYYQTYWCQYPLHVVFNELEILAGYKVIAANTTKEIFVWTLHKP